MATFDHEQLEHIAGVVERVIDIKVTPRLVMLEKEVRGLREDIHTSRADAREDADALNSVVVEHEERLTALEGFHGIDRQPTEA